MGGIGYGRYWWSIGRFIESTDDAYAGGNVTAVAPHVAGFIAQILATDNQHVRAGQLERFPALLEAHAQTVERSGVV